jgi:hypothetical protein
VLQRCRRALPQRPDPKQKDIPHVTYQDNIASAAQAIGARNGTWDGIDAEAVARMKLQNRFNTGLDIAKYTAAIMRRDMAAYDASSGSRSSSASRSISVPPKAATCTCRAGWSPRCAATSARCPTNRCTKRPACPR